jgi:hypothetical protein
MSLFVAIAALLTSVGAGIGMWVGVTPQAGRAWSSPPDVDAPPTFDSTERESPGMSSLAATASTRVTARSAELRAAVVRVVGLLSRRGGAIGSDDSW